MSNLTFKFCIDFVNDSTSFAGALGKAPSVNTESLPVPETPDVPVSDEEDEEDMTEMRERLQALRS